MKGITEPRLYTPELKPLSNDNSLGYAAIEYANTVLHKSLYPWQEWALIHALEIVGDLGGDWHFRFRVILFMLSRQNGKTVLSEVIASFFLNVLMAENVFGTSLSLEKAEEVWEAVIGDQQTYPELSRDVARISRTNGKKRLSLTGGRTYKVGAPSRRAGRGDSNDLVMLDELREHRDWETWSAAAASTIAKPNGVVMCFTNAGDPDSIVLRQIRSKALGRDSNFGGEMDDGAIGLFEWSAKEGAATDDMEALAQANPALGYGLLTERSLQASRESFPETKFRSECMCQMVETLLDPPFPDGAWESALDNNSFIPMAEDVFYGIDLSHDRRWTSIAACGRRDDGNWHIEVVARRVGTEWAIDWFRQRAFKKGNMKLAFQGRGAPVSGLAEQICTLNSIERINIEGAELSNSWGRFYDGICANLPDRTGEKIFHLDQPVLNAPGHTMQLKNMGGGIALPDRIKSPDDIAPVFACIMAFAAANRNPEQGKKIYESAYSNGADLVFV